jgi:hypothetical protein
VGIGRQFELTATDEATGQPVQPQQPYTLIVYYTPESLGPVIENTLGLYYWDGGQWVQEPGSLDTAAHSITAHPSHFSLWAVFGQTRWLFLPVLWR